jgi:hypothetical protein
LEASKTLSFDRLPRFQFAGMTMTSPLEGKHPAGSFPAIHSLFEQGQLHLLRLLHKQLVPHPGYADRGINFAG